MTEKELAISIISSIEKGYKWEDFKYSDYLYGEDEKTVDWAYEMYEECVQQGTIDFYRKYIEDE